MSNLIRRLSNRSGMAMVLSMLLLLAVGSTGLMLVTTSGREKRIVTNEIGKIKAFYASEGVLNVLCQQVLNGKAEKYMTTSGSATNYAINAYVSAGLMNDGTTSEKDGTWNDIDNGYTATRVHYDDFLNDGDPETYWMSKDNNPGKGDTITVFFGRNIVFNKVAFDYAGAETPGDFLDWKLSYYTVDRAWDTIKTGYGTVNAITFPPSVGSAVRFWTAHTEYLRIGEFEVYDTGSPGVTTWNVNDMTVDFGIVPDANGWIIQTDAYKETGDGKIAYSAPLKQFFVPTLTTSYPPHAYVPVIFYDYKCDGSNPNFQVDVLWLTGQVENRLDSDRKPQLKADLLFNAHLEQWFWPSGTNGRDPGVKFIFDGELNAWRWAKISNSDYLDNRSDGAGNDLPGEYVGPNWNSTDSMANIVIPSILVFTLQDSTTGTYTFHQTYWNPLASRGWGNERCDYCTCWPDAYLKYGGNNCQTGCKNGTIPRNSGNYFANQKKLNYAYTMELHSTFIYKGGETFTFEGDDDVWVFINDSLVIDIGGVHPAWTKSVTLDNAFAAAAGMTVGEEYKFDFFYCERRVHDANCKITTNIDIMGLYKTVNTNWRKDYNL